MTPNTSAPLALPAFLENDKPHAFEQLEAFEPGKDTLVADARAYLTGGRERLKALHRTGASGRTVVRATSELTDRLVRGLHQALLPQVKELPPIALAALGGYGRKELNPRSDLDLFLLHDGPGEPKKPVAEFAEKLLYILWDLKLEVGWGVRTAKECARLASEDHTARTALVDCRLVVGSEAVYQGLERAVLVDLVSRHADEFIADKVDEMKKRREKYGDSVFVLEPNVKQGEGALRDLQAALWIARARFKSTGVSDLLHRSILPPGEVAEVKKARDLLWRVRNELHYSTGRKEDRLTFDLQIQVADKLGYREGPMGLPVEQFMRHYYLAASVIRRAADALVGRCEETRKRSAPVERRLDHEFKIWSGKLTINDPELFATRPAAMVRLFAMADREGLPLYSYARDRVTHELTRIDDKVREDPAVAATLRQMFVRPGTRGEFLSAMHGLGVLAAVFPEFGRITALHQHDLYHVYTVDVHSIFAVKRLHALRNGELAEQEPELTRLMQNLARPLPLYLGMLFHDCGKGGGGGHSERGAKLVQKVCERLGLTARDSSDTEFLVLRHLLMSHVSQRRDLSDPQMIESFAKDCGDQDRLLMLYLLTYADMCSVAPNTWNDWRARLLRELYEKSRLYLESAGQPSQSSAAAPAPSVKIPDAQLVRERLELHFPKTEVDAFLAVMPERYLRTVAPEDAVRHDRVLRRGKKRPLAASLIHRAHHTDLTLTAPDRPGLLALFTGTLAAHKIDIMHAEIFSTTDGRALDVFSVRGRQGGRVERERWRAARADLKAALSGTLDVEALLKRRTASGLAEKFVPRVVTQIAIDNRSAADATVIDVYTQDRIGLLHTISRVFFDHGIEISLAKIATEGNKAADAFYVRKGGAKIEDLELLERVKEALRAALVKG